MKKKTLMILALVLIIAGGLWYLNSASLVVDTEDGSPGNVLALVNGEEIMFDRFDALKSQIISQQGLDQGSLDEETVKQIEFQIIDELITQVLLKQEADKSGIIVTPEEVGEQLDLLIMQIGGEKTFKQALLMENISEEELREQLNTQLMIQKYLEEKIDTSSIVVTDEEVEEVYEQEVARNEEVPELEDARGQIEGQIFQQKQYNLVEQFIQQLIEQADVEIFV